MNWVTQLSNKLLLISQNLGLHSRSNRLLIIKVHFYVSVHTISIIIGLITDWLFLNDLAKPIIRNGLSAYRYAKYKWITFELSVWDLNYARMYSRCLCICLLLSCLYYGVSCNESNVTVINNTTEAASTTVASATDAPEPVETTQQPPSSTKSTSTTSESVETTPSPETTTPLAGKSEKY